MTISTIMAAGLDVGYGGLKAVSSTAGGGAVHEVVLPSGAAPQSAMPVHLDNSVDLKGGEPVLVDGKPWVAGVEQPHIQNRTRMTHDDFPRTPEYTALYLAGLARLSVNRVEALVTGLPVGQFYSPGGAALAAFLRMKLSGLLRLSAEAVVNVAQVMVVPQPLGTFFGLASEPDYAALATETHLRSLVVDPGFFSVDWVVMSGQSVMRQHSGMSKQATSVILERAAAEISEAHGREISRDQLDCALRTGQDRVAAGFRQSVELAPFLKRAADAVADVMVGEMKTALRSAGPIDLVILTGGGSPLYADTIRQAYANITVVQPSDVVLGNARGYCAIARMKAAQRTSAAA